MEFLNEIYENVVLNQTPRSFFIFIIIAIATYRIPIIDKILRTFHTLLHESGHAFAAMLTGSKNHRMELNTNMSGLTITESKNKIRQFVISLSGYPFASAFSWLGFLLILNNTPGIFHILLLSIAGIQLIMNIRNTYGIIWSIAVIALLAAQLLKMPQLMWSTGVIICTVIHFESLIMSGYIFSISFTKPSMSGDAANLQKLTGIHAGFWGLFFLAQALFFSYLIVQLVIDNLY
jgi:hypothetical protein